MEGNDAYIVHDGCPSLHRDALKYGEHGEEDVVEADDAELGSLPAGLTLGLVGRTQKAAAADTGGAVVAQEGAGRQLLLADQIPLACGQITV